MQLKIPSGKKKYTPNKSQADLLKSNKEIRRVEKHKIEEKPIEIERDNHELEKIKNFTLLINREEKEKYLKLAKEKGREFSSFLVYTLRTNGLFELDDIFLGNVLSENKEFNVTLRLTLSEHKAIERVKNIEGRSKNQVVSMFLYQTLINQC